MNLRTISRRIALVSILLAAIGLSLGAVCVPLPDDGDGSSTNGAQNGDVAGSPQPGQSSEASNNNSNSAIPGDMDGDGIVGQSDVAVYTAAYKATFGLSEGDPGFDPSIDLDGDGMITFADLQAFNALVE